MQDATVQSINEPSFPVAVAPSSYVAAAPAPVAQAQIPVGMNYPNGHRVNLPVAHQARLNTSPNPNRRFPVQPGVGVQQGGGTTGQPAPPRSRQHRQLRPRRYLKLSREAGHGRRQSARVFHARIA